MSLPFMLTPGSAAIPYIWGPSYWEHRICQDQGVQFTRIKAIPCNVGGPVLNLGGCQHFGRFVDLCPPQRVLQPLIYFLQAQRPGPLAEVHQHCGAQQVRQQGKRLVDSCRVGARTHSSLQTVPRRSAWARATSPAHPAPPVTGGEGPHSAL